MEKHPSIVWFYALECTKMKFSIVVSLLLAGFVFLAEAGTFPDGYRRLKRTDPRAQSAVLEQKSLIIKLAQRDISGLRLNQIKVNVDGITEVGSFFMPPYPPIWYVNIALNSHAYCRLFFVVDGGKFYSFHSK